MNYIKAPKDNIKILASSAGLPTTGKENVFYYIIDESKLVRWNNTITDYDDVEFNFVIKANERGLAPGLYESKIYATDSNGEDTLIDVASLGVSQFIQLTDTPATYSGQDNKFVAVNATGDGLVFVDPVVEPVITAGTGISITGTYPNITINTVTHTGDVTGDVSLTISNNAVSNTKAADMPAMTIKGNDTNALADPKDLTVTEVRTLLNVSDGAEENVQSDWNEADTNSDAFILNKPTNVSAFTNDANYQNQTEVENAINSAISSVYKVKGSVADFASLPTSGNVAGDVWNTADTGMNYVWTGSEWDALGSTVDLSNYYTKTESDNKFVELTTNTNKIYGTDNNGDAKLYDIDTTSPTFSTLAGNIPIRNTDVSITIDKTAAEQTSFDNKSAVNKEYVDAQITSLKTKKFIIDLSENDELVMYLSESIKINSFTLIEGTTFTMDDGNDTYTSADIGSMPVYPIDQKLTFTTTSDAICRINYTEQ